MIIKMMMIVITIMIIYYPPRGERVALRPAFGAIGPAPQEGAKVLAGAGVPAMAGKGRGVFGQCFKDVHSSFFHISLVVVAYVHRLRVCVCTLSILRTAAGAATLVCGDPGDSGSPTPPSPPQKPWNRTALRRGSRLPKIPLSFSLATVKTDYCESIFQGCFH